jgi:hypothetical protein
LLPSPLDDVDLLLEPDEESLFELLELESLLAGVDSFVDVDSVDEPFDDSADDVFDDDFAPDRLSVL